jgi:hypothetical protein
MLSTGPWQQRPMLSPLMALQLTKQSLVSFAVTALTVKQNAVTVFWNSYGDDAV